METKTEILPNIIYASCQCQHWYQINNQPHKIFIHLKDEKNQIWDFKNECKCELLPYVSKSKYDELVKASQAVIDFYEPKDHSFGGFKLLDNLKKHIKSIT